MDVGDAPEIVDSRRGEGETLRDLARAFKAEPPTGFSKKTISKYRNALKTFAAWAAPHGFVNVSQVTSKTISRWIKHLKEKELLDASTIVPKIRIVLGEMKRHGTEVKLEERSLPTITTRERNIYTADELEAMFSGCTLPTFPHPRRRRGICKTHCATLTIQPVQKIGQTTKDRPTPCGGDDFA